MAKKAKTKTGMDEDVNELAQILADNPLIEQRIRETIEHHLKRGIDDATYINILMSLNLLVGIKATRLIVDSLKANSSKFFQDIKEQMEGENIDKVLPFLQYLTALYGDDVGEAYNAFGEKPDDWNRGEVTAFREGGKAETWLLELNLTKYNGTTVYLRMAPWSALLLARHILGEINKVPKGVITEGSIERFNQETKAFQEKFLGNNSSKD